MTSEILRDVNIHLKITFFSGLDEGEKKWEKILAKPLRSCEKT
jgi:hypothetical protein